MYFFILQNPLDGLRGPIFSASSSEHSAGLQLLLDPLQAVPVEIALEDHADGRGLFGNNLRPAVSALSIA